MQTQPKVTVVIPTHNRRDLLDRAIKSVLNQTYENIEVIVADDGSTDGTSEMMERYQDNSNVFYYRNTVARGANAARNLAISHATGQFVAGLDDDDEFLPERIAVLVREYDPVYAFITSRQSVLMANNRVKERKKRETITPEEILYQNFIGTQVLVEKARIDAVGGYDESLVSCQDYDMWIRLMQRYGNVRIVPEFLFVKHDEHTYETISSGKKTFNGYWQVYRKHKNGLNPQQRKRRLFDMYRIRRKTLSFRTMNTLTGMPEKVALSFKLYLFFEPLYYYLKGRFF